MKTFRSARHRQVHCAAQAAAIFAGFVLPLSALAQTTNSVSGMKDHVLFVGTDLSVNQDGKLYHVVGATKTTLKIEREHALADVRLASGANIKVNKGVKLSNLSAMISHVQTESVDRASARAQLAAMQASMALMDDVSDQQDRLQGAIVRAQTFGDARIDDPLFHGFQGAPGYEKKADASYYIEKFATALPALDRLRDSANTVLMQDIAHAASADDEVTLDASKLPGLNLIGGSAVSDSGSGGSSKSFERANTPDGTAEVELTFDVSSPEPLDDAYILIVANYASLTNADKVARQVSARELEHIDSHPVHVKMVHPASINRLPFKKFDMALFANGQEVATNLSEKRMPLTRDQAFQFFLIDHLSAHKGATLPPTPLLMTPRAEFRRLVDKTATSQTIYAKIDKSGNVLAISADAAGSQRLSASAESALQNVRFLPALEKGTPVDGHLKIRIADLVR
jgi:hypothetical protein